MNAKYIYVTLGIFLTIAGLMSCQDTLEERYLNPEKTTEPSIAKFFTKMEDNRRVRADYWNIRTFLVMHPGVYTNVISYTNSPRRYQQQLSYLNDFWKDFYTPQDFGDGKVGSGVVPHMREIEKEYGKLSGEDKANAEVFLHAAHVIFYDQASQMVDLWGDIPFSEAGGLNLSESTAPPKFDDAEEIYASLLEGLKTSAAFFSSATLDPLVASSFRKQDMLLQGSMGSWERYANSIRLRLLMRISFQDENKARTDIMEMLNAPSDYPLVDEATFNVLLSPLTTYTDNMRNAVTELLSHAAPEFMLDEVLKPANDPRIRVLFDKDASQADYFAMPADLPASEQEENIADGEYAILDSSTFMINTKFPGIVITSAEVNFIKAEAFERWGSTADAQLAYEKAVKQAVEFDFYLNRVGATFRGLKDEDMEAPLDPDEITDLLAAPTVAYTGSRDEKLEKIGTQKWLHFGFMQSIQGWSEYRRTKYPTLTFIPDNTPGWELPPTRLVYPESEKVYNPDNYASVAAGDKPDVKIFWDIK